MAIGKQRLPALHVLTLLHHPHRIFGTVGNTSDTSLDTYAVSGFARQGHHGVATAFRFLGIALYGFLQYEVSQLFRTNSGKYDQPSRVLLTVVTS
jgi:hypothetical protein